MATVQQIPLSPWRAIIETGLYANSVHKTSMAELYDFSLRQPEIVATSHPMYNPGLFGLPEDAVVLVSNDGSVVGRTARARLLVRTFDKSQSDKIQALLREAVYQFNKRPALHLEGVIGLHADFMIKAQNAQISAGQLGGLPSVKEQRINFTVSVQDRLQTPEQFRDILLKVNTDGSTVRLGDVAKVELGAENSQIVSRFNGQPAAALAIKLATGANALKTVEAIAEYTDSISSTFPAGMKVVEAFDTTPFVRISIEEVVRTLLEAVVLVFLVMYLFLQNFRATLIPTIAVPVVLLGTFGVLAAFGYSINTLTMFAMVLAIGLLVDDAIVVVENVERIMHEDGLSARDATHLSMTQISGALVGIALVLSAVFVPMAFFGGSTGVIYRQFSITVVSAMVLSVLVALILTPALCATMLKPAKPGQGKRGFFGLFNRGFDRTAGGYQKLVGSMTRRWGRSMVLYTLILAAMMFLFQRLPTGFLPDEDQGILFVQVQLPIGATQDRALNVLKASASIRAGLSSS